MGGRLERVVITADWPAMASTLPHARILGTGPFLAQRVRTNRDIERLVDTWGLCPAIDIGDACTIKPGDTVVMSALGAGLSWGGAVVRS
jgi:3-oxoacyl-[acyl-carrier-protein] synthase III